MICVTRELHDTPPEVELRLRLAGGVNRFGEANYRAVWGWNRLTWIGGKWEDRTAAGDLVREVVELRREPKYLPTNRWHIEKWCAPEDYGSPRDWYAQTIERSDGISIPALGPYPTRGEYELSYTLETPAGEFVQLTPAIAQRVARLVETSRNSFSSAERKAALLRREEAAERESAASDMALLSENDEAFYGAPAVTVL